MSLEGCQRDEDAQNGVEVQNLGPAILAPAEALHNLVEKSNELISEHRHWLAIFPRNTESSTISSTSRTSDPQITTSPPSLKVRAASPEPQLLSNLLGQDCTSSIAVATASQGSILSASISAVSASAAAQIASVSSQLGSALAQASQLAKDPSQLATLSSQAAAASAGSISAVSALSSANGQLSAANSQLASANDALARVTSSIAGISGGNAAAAQSANLAIAAATSSANSLVSAAQANASSANAIATSIQISASSAVSIAEASASSVSLAADAALESASEILKSASGISKSASEIPSATNGGISTSTLAQAMATVVTPAAQTSTAVYETPKIGISPSGLALAVVLSIIGSSVASILAYYFFQRYWNRKKLSKKLSLTYPLPVYYGNELSEKKDADDEISIEEGRRQSMGNGRNKSASFQVYRNAINNPDPHPGVLVPHLAPLPLEPVRKTMIYDPSRNSDSSNERDSKPRFLSWLSHSVRTVSTFAPLVDFRTSKEIKAARKKEEDAEVRKMALRKVKEGEERRELERRKRESDERRLRIRVENEEVERLVGLRRERARMDSRDRARSTRESRDEAMSVVNDRFSIGTAR